MNYKTITLVLVTILFIYNVIIKFLMKSSTKRSVPENVRDVYDSEAYEKWQNYSAEKINNQLYGIIAQYAVFMILIVFDVFALISRYVGENDILQAIAILAFYELVTGIVDTIFGYTDTMKIETKYGFNKTTKKTFFTDRIKEFILGFIISFGLVCLFVASYIIFKNWVLLAFTGIIFLLILLVYFLTPVFAKIFNKFTPLEEGSLRTKLENLLNKNGYKVKEIKVMDGSRRSTKANAYFSGLGKTKDIVLYDTIMDVLTEDEIVAVFAHELGHGKYKHIIKSYAMGLFQVFLIVVLSWYLVSNFGIVRDFGFRGRNYGFMFILVFSVALPYISSLMSLITKRISRKFENKADEFAKKEGYGEYLISGLKKISRANYSNLNPHPVIVALEYSHPPLSQRIANIEEKK